MSGIEVAGMSTCQLMDVRRNRVVGFRPQDQVPVVGHQAIGDDAHRNTVPRALNKSLKMRVIVNAAKRCLSLPPEGVKSVSADESPHGANGSFQVRTALLGEPTSEAAFL